MDIFLIAVRAVHFASCLALCSCFAVLLLVVRPALAPVAGQGGEAAIRDIRRWLRASLAAGFVSGFLWFWLSVAGMSGSGMLDSLGYFGMVLTQTTPGRVWLVRAALAVLLAPMLWVRPGKAALGTGALLALLLTVSLSGLGHAGAVERGPLPLAGDILHLAAAGIWPAGLLPLALVLRRWMADERLLDAASTAVRRFSVLALACVFALVLSGLSESYFLVRSIPALWITPYGRWLLLKLSLFAVAAWMGAQNRFRHKPALVQGGQERDAALRAIRRNVMLELLLGMAIVLVVAVLGITPPPSP